MSSSFFPRRRRQPFNQFGMGGWSQSPSFFGRSMHPLDLFSNLGNFSNFSNFMPPMLNNMSNIIDPFLDQLMRRNLRWIGQPTRALQPQLRRRPKSLLTQRSMTTLPVQRRRMQQQVQVQKTTGRKLGVLGGVKMPQKYRILIGSTGVSPSALRTQVKCVGDQRHLIVFGPQTGRGMQQGTPFKRSFTLPPQVDIKKMSKFVTPMGCFCVEFPFLEVPTSLGIQLRPQICKMPEGQVVMVRVPIPEFVDPAKVQLQLKGKEIIVRFEERLVNCDIVQRVFYYNRVVLPEGVNVSQLKAKSDKHRLIITAPVPTQAKSISKGLRIIPIQRKLRQRKGVKPVSPDSKKISGGVEKKKKQLPVTPIQKKKKQLSTTTDTDKKKDISSISSKPTSGTKLPEPGKITSKAGISTDKKPVSSEKKSVSTDKKSVSSEKKPISTDQMSPISTDKKKSKKKSTATSTQGSQQKGSDILKNVFGTQQGTQLGTQQGMDQSTVQGTKMGMDQSTVQGTKMGTDQRTEQRSTGVDTKDTKKESSGQTSDVGQVLSGFQSSPSDVTTGSSSEGQQQK